MSEGWFPSPFTPEYEVEVGGGIPNADLPVYRFPQGMRTGGEKNEPHLPLVVRFAPASSGGWIGHFGRSLSPWAERDGHVGVYATPSPSNAVVLTGDTVFLVDVRHPPKTAELPLHRRVRALAGPRLLLVSDISSVVAIGPHGVEWTNYLSSYGDFDVVDVTNDIVTCRVRDRDGLEWECALATSSGEILDREPVGHLGGIDSRFSSESGVTIEVFAPSNLPGILLDVDVTPDGHWLAIAGSRDGKMLIFPDETMPLPGPTWYSMVRSIDDDHALVVGGVSGDVSPAASAWIMSAARGVERTFDAGSSSNLLASVRHIVATYGDQGGFSVEPYPFEKALAVFDGEGNYLFGYYEEFGDQVVDAYHVYALCWSGDEAITFYPYPEFALVQIDLVRREQRVIPGPAAVKGFHAMSVRGEDVFFHGGYDQRSVIWRWQQEIDELKPVGEFNGQTRGLRDGKFIAFEGKEFAVITCP